MIKSDDQQAGGEAEPQRSRRGHPRPREEGSRTRELLLAAAVEVLTTEGYAGATARHIARVAGVNSALLFYHYGGVDELLLAVCDRVSRDRLARYRQQLDAIDDPAELIRRTLALFREDLRSPHITVLQELVAGASYSASLRPALVARMDPWIEYCEGVIRRVVAGSPLSGAVESGDLAFLVISAVLGIETMGRLARDDQRIPRLLDAVEELSPLLLLAISGRRSSGGQARPERLVID